MPSVVQDNTLIERLGACLEQELGEAGVAREFAVIVAEEALVWRAPELPMGQISLILGFTFGNRLLSNGNRVPGPVNERLADIVAAMHRQTGAPVLAQWEVAEALVACAPAVPVTAINPGRDARGEPVYLGTQAVAAEMARLAGSLGGPVGVVAFADHIRRAVSAARARVRCVCPHGLGDARRVRSGLGPDMVP